MSEATEVIDMQADVREFMQAMRQDCPIVPAWPAYSIQDMRLGLIREEFEEYKKADFENNMPELADAMADMIYVIIGSALAHGIDLTPIWREVHRSNMAKLSGGMREDGKVMKPVGWVGPEVAGCLKAQGWKKENQDGGAR